MILTCPECGSHFMVGDDAIPEDGRKVKCGDCKHIWHQDPLSEGEKEEIEEVKKNQAENLKQAVAEKASGVEPKLPAIYKSKPAPFAMKAAVAAMLVLNLFGFIFFNKDKVGIEFIYDLIGQSSTDGLIIEKVVMLDPFISEDDVTYYIDWKVKNESEEIRQKPNARISLLSKKKQTLKQSAGSLDGEIPAGESFRIKANKIEDKGKKGRYLLIEIGNSVELSSR